MEMQEQTRKPRVRRLAATRFLVESKSRPGIGHQVDTLHLTCSCESGKHHRRCWHLVWALQAERLYKEAEAEHKTRLAATSARPAAIVRGHLEESAGYKALAECFA